mmetsp:Transcript_11176/g.35508  ORF Transcript_11176/g.35508 Transcript_11176/m.35508 type:complete len:186 (-) Transcript_11176:334-891(-)
MFLTLSFLFATVFAGGCKPDEFVTVGKTTHCALVGDSLSCDILCLNTTDAPTETTGFEVVVSNIKFEPVASGDTFCGLVAKYNMKEEPVFFNCGLTDGASFGIGGRCKRQSKYDEWIISVLPHSALFSSGGVVPRPKKLEFDVTVGLASRLLRVGRISAVSLSVEHKKKRASRRPRRPEYTKRVG